MAEFAIDYRKIDKYDLVFRIMTFDHVPDEPGRKKNPKTVADTKVKLNFPPFQHFKFNDKDELVCIGKSHWEGCLLYTSPSPRDKRQSRMPSSA